MQPPPAGRVGVRHFAAETSSVPKARRYTADLAHAWDLGDVVDTAELLVAELTTNAVEASCRTGGHTTPGRRERIALRLTCTDTTMVIEVWDEAAAVPVRRAQAAEAESGRGLFLVEALSQDFGYYPTSGGKVVWCVIAFAGSPFPSADGRGGPPGALPRRDAGATAVPDPEPGRPVDMERDLPLLRRVVDGLRALDSWHLPSDADWDGLLAGLTRADTGR